MLHNIDCRECGRLLGQVEAAVNLEITCPRCKCTNRVNTYGDTIVVRLARMPTERVEQLMRSRGVDERRC